MNSTIQVHIARAQEAVQAHIKSATHDLNHYETKGKHDAAWYHTAQKVVTVISSLFLLGMMALCQYGTGYSFWGFFGTAIGTSILSAILNSVFAYKEHAAQAKGKAAELYLNMFNPHALPHHKGNLPPVDERVYHHVRNAQARNAGALTSIGEYKRTLDVYGIDFDDHARLRAARAATSSTLWQEDIRLPLPQAMSEKIDAMVASALPAHEEGTKAEREHPTDQFRKKFYAAYEAYVATSAALITEWHTKDLSFDEPKFLKKVQQSFPSLEIEAIEAGLDTIAQEIGKLDASVDEIRKQQSRVGQMEEIRAFDQATRLKFYSHRELELALSFVHLPDELYQEQPRVFGFVAWQHDLMNQLVALDANLKDKAQELQKAGISAESIEANYAWIQASAHALATDEHYAAGVIQRQMQRQHVDLALFLLKGDEPEGLFHYDQQVKKIQELIDKLQSSSVSGGMDHYQRWLSEQQRSCQQLDPNRKGIKQLQAVVNALPEEKRKQQIRWLEKLAMKKHLENYADQETFREELITRFRNNHDEIKYKIEPSFAERLDKEYFNQLLKRIPLDVVTLEEFEAAALVCNQEAVLYRSEIEAFKGSEKNLDEKAFTKQVAAINHMISTEKRPWYSRVYRAFAGSGKAYELEPFGKSNNRVQRIINWTIEREDKSIYSTKKLSMIALNLIPTIGLGISMAVIQTPAMFLGGFAALTALQLPGYFLGRRIEQKESKIDDMRMFEYLRFHKLRGASIEGSFEAKVCKLGYGLEGYELTQARQLLDRPQTLKMPAQVEHWIKAHPLDPVKHKDFIDRLVE